MHVTAGTPCFSALLIHSSTVCPMQQTLSTFSHDAPGPVDAGCSRVAAVSQTAEEDATATLLNLIFKHLEGSKTHAGILFADFSSAFNTIQPHILVDKL